MAEEDELFYLQPGFDLHSLTIPRIRNILVSQNISYPASAKKAQLIEIMENEILPKARKLLNAQARVRRTSKGITDVPSSQEGTIDGDSDDDRELMPPPPAPKTPRSRKSKSNLVDDVGSATPSTSKRTRTPRRTSSKTPRASDTETDAEKPKPSARKSRKSVPGPIPVTTPHSVHIEEPDRKLKRESLAASDSPFSDDNPFQSGSSPPSDHRVTSTSRSRKSLDSKEKRKSTISRRQTSSPTFIKREDEETTSHTSYRVPLSRINPDEIPTTEEFTPAAKRELEEEGQLVPQRSSTLVRRKKPISTAAKATPLAVLTTVLAAIAGWYRQEKINIGYCGVGHPNWSLASNPHIPAWIHENAEPKCEPCPQHAFCFPNMEVKCEDDFILQQHPLSLNGLMPLPPTCEPDSEKERRIKAVADRAVEELRERRAAYECGEEINNVDDADIENVKTIVKTGEIKLEIPEETLKKEVSKMRRKDMSADEFDDLWRGALGDIMNREEIEVVRDGSGRIFLSSTSLARLPITCAIRRSIFRTVTENRIPISILVMFFSAIAYVRYRIITYQQATAQIPALVATTLDRLATQAALKEDGRLNEGFISVGQLRDDVLRNVFNARERERVWQGVRRVVEGNSNVRTSTREGGKTGEWSRAWEWIGPVNLAIGFEGRQSGLLQGSEMNGNKEDLSVRRWDEGRPIY